MSRIPTLLLVIVAALAISVSITIIHAPHLKLLMPTQLHWFMPLVRLFGILMLQVT
jgi:hypothetical protein